MKNKVIAHRGAFKKKNHPENSIASLGEAIALGCKGSEFDIWMTKDNVLVIHHDAEFNDHHIEKTTYQELSAYQLSNGESLPTLESYLKIFSDTEQPVTIVCEIKPSEINKERGLIIAEQTLSLIQKYNLKQEIIYISFDYDILKKIIALYPDANTQYLEGDKSPMMVKKDGIRGVDYDYEIFRKRPEWIWEAKEFGVELNSWTVNDEAVMDWLLSNDFDYITTNEPELLLSKKLVVH